MKASYQTPAILEELFDVEDVMKVSVVGEDDRATYETPDTGADGDQIFDADTTTYGAFNPRF